MTDRNLMRSFISDCQVDLHVGLDPSEKLRAQRVIINVALEADLTQRFDDLANENIAQVMNYAPVRDFICNELPHLGHIGLIETVAERVIDFCFRDQRVRRACVSVAKPRLFPETAAVGIELVRTR